MSSTTTETVKCEFCGKEIPKSAALSAEGKDYTWYFCGKDCYEKWVNPSEDEVK